MNGMHQIYNSFQEVNEVQMEINFLEAVLRDGPRAHVLYYVGVRKLFFVGIVN
jgi:hypothetical protein